MDGWRVRVWPTPDGSSALIVEWYDKARAFLNRCPHWGVRVDEHGTRIVRGGKLVCSVHGATFDPDTGESDEGPCAKQALPLLPVALRDDVIDIFRSPSPLGRL